MIAHTLLLLLFTSSSLTQSFNNSFPDWPEYCCNLELTPHHHGQPLPKDTIPAGRIDGKGYAFAIDRQDNNEIMIVSEDPAEYPICPIDDCDSDKEVTSYEVVTNPNKCAIGWYETRYESERFSRSTRSARASATEKRSVSREDMESKRIVSPAFNGFLFATREYGDEQIWSGMCYFTLCTIRDIVIGGRRILISSSCIFHHNDLVTGTYKDGESVTCFNSSYHSKRTINPGTMVMFVDCLKSLSSMADAKLVNIKISERDVDAVKTAPIVYYKRTFVNTNYLPQQQSIQFTAERTNTMFVSASDSFSSSKCDAQENSFTRMFGSSMRTSSGIKTNALLMGMNAKLGMDVASAFNTMSERSLAPCNKQRDSASSPMHRENKKYTFSDEISLPAKSITTVTATSSPFRGTIPYTMTYELTSPANMGSSLRQALEFYRIGDSVSSAPGSVLVHFDGAMLVDAGNEIEVEVTAVPLHAPLSGYILNSKQAVFPSV